GEGNQGDGEIERQSGAGLRHSSTVPEVRCRTGDRFVSPVRRGGGVGVASRWTGDKLRSPVLRRISGNFGTFSWQYGRTAHGGGGTQARRKEPGSGAGKPFPRGRSRGVSR